MRALVVALALSTMVAGCSAGTRSPEGAVRALGEAAADGDRAAVYRLLGPTTRARLEADAKHAAELSGRRSMKPEEMLAVGWFPPRLRASDVREVERSGDRAVVEVIGKDGERERLTCVRDGGLWKVELP
jgi:hypothetical protein